MGLVEGGTKGDSNELGKGWRKAIKKFSVLKVTYVLLKNIGQVM